MQTTHDSLAQRLGDLTTLCPELEAVAMVSVEGVPIASFPPDDANDEHLYAMSAAMAGLGERIAADLGRGQLDHLTIKGELGFVLLMSVNEEAVLTAVVNDDSNMGLLLLDMRRAASDFANMF